MFRYNFLIHTLAFQDFYTTSAAFPEWIKDDDLEVKLVRKYRNKKVGLESFFFKAALDTFGKIS